MDSSISISPLGSKLSLVARVLRQSDVGTYECIGLSPEQEFRLEGAPALQLDRIYTFYELMLVGDGLPLVFGEGSSCYLKPSLDLFKKVEIFDVCNGIGGFAIGSHQLGFETRLFLECNALACEQLRANFPIPVIHGSVEDAQCIQEAHAMRTQGLLQVTGGFPCQ